MPPVGDATISAPHAVPRLSGFELPPGYALPIQSDTDVVRARQAARQWAARLGFRLVDQTRIVTAASELARNTLIHGGAGTVYLEAVEAAGRFGLRLTFTDTGPGILDIERAMCDGF